MSGGKEGLIPVFKGHGGIGKKSKPHVKYAMMFAFCRSILLLDVRARHKVRYTNRVKERIQALILTTPVSLHSNDFLIKKSLYKIMKFFRIWKLYIYDAEDKSR
jgi:hypothetical protein